MFAQLGRSTAPYQTLVTESVGLLNLALRGAGLALEGSEDVPADWLPEWKSEVAGTRAALAAKRAALPPFRPGLLKSYAVDPKVARMVAALETFPDVTGRIADQVLATVDEVVPLVEAASDGDAQAKVRLRLTILRGMAESLVAQDALLDMVAVLSDERHPQTHLTGAVKAAHAARRLLIEFRIDQMSGKSPDPDATLAAVRRALADSRAEAAKVRPLVREWLAKVSASDLAPSLKARMKTAFDTYGPSADVEVQIANLIEQNMHIYVEDVSDPMEIEAFDRDIQGLSDQRMALQKARVSALSQ